MSVLLHQHGLPVFGGGGLLLLLVLRFFFKLFVKLAVLSVAAVALFALLVTHWPTISHGLGLHP